MMCDVVLALLITFNDGTVQKVQRQGAPLSAVVEAEKQVSAMQNDPAFQAQIKEQGIKSVTLEVKKMPKPFPCEKDPEAKPEGK